MTAWGPPGKQGESQACHLKSSKCGAQRDRCKGHRFVKKSKDKVSTEAADGPSVQNAARIQEGISQSLRQLTA